MPRHKTPDHYERLYAIMEVRESSKRGIAGIENIAPDFIINVSAETILEKFGVITPSKYQFEFADYLAKCCRSAGEGFTAAVTPDYDIAAGLVARFAADNRVSERRYILSEYVHVQDLMNVKHLRRENSEKS